MNRKALLIGSPGNKGSDSYLGGVARDIQNYDRYLRSAAGGSWYASEIQTLEYPTTSEVRQAIRPLESADYSFVLFSGHGYYDAKRNSTIACLCRDDEIDSSELRKGCTRHTLVLDCCRVVERHVLAEDTIAKADQAPRKLDAAECRYYFDKQVLSSPRGLIVLHACAIDETAGDDMRC